MFKSIGMRSAAALSLATCIITQTLTEWCSLLEY